MSCLILRQVLWPWHCLSDCIFFIIVQASDWLHCQATNLNNIQYRVWACPILDISLKQTITFGTHCLSWRHTVWLSDKLSDSETCCLILRQAVWIWDRLFDECIGCLVSRQTVQALEWLYCHASLWQNCGLSVILHSKPQKVCCAASHLYAQNFSIYSLWLQLCTLTNSDVECEVLV